MPGELARVILRRYGKRQIYAKPRAPSSRPPAESMLATRRIFTEAAAYSTGVFRNPARRAPFEARVAAAGAQVYPTIATEFLKNPIIREVKIEGYHGHTGDMLAVLACTDLSLAAVHGVLRRGDDTVVEEGDVVLASGEFRYTTTRDVPAGANLFAEVTVCDTDGLEVKHSVPLPVA